MTRFDRPKPAPKPGASVPWLAAIALLSLGAVAAALVSQHVYDMQPCPWCVLQRAIFVVIALACVVGLVWRTAAGRVVSASLVSLLAASGVAAAAWQHFVAAKSASCNLTLADKIVTALKLDTLLPQVFSATASCADAAVNLLGVPYDFWALGLFAVLALMGLRQFFSRA
jgi:protein dithiol:quinone oxidoreductase